MKDRLAEIFKKMFAVDAISEDLGPENVEGWDSYNHIELVLELESEFGVSITTEQAVELTSVGGIMEFLRSKGVE